jgi:alpha-ribazole phosphatase
MKLWLLRHAQPLIDTGICYGATDVAADTVATEATAMAFAQLVPQFLTVSTSPLQRCEQLAETLKGLRPDLTIRQDIRLAEMDFGCWEGVRWAAIGKEAFDPWMADFGSYRFGGRESVNMLMHRVTAALQDTRILDTEAIWITHAGVIRAATLIAQGTQELTRADQWPKDVPAFGAWCQIEL